MTNVDFDNCFYGDLYGKEFKYNSIRTERQQRPEITYYIFDEAYRDPDGESEKLYQYHKKIWNYLLPNGYQLKSIDRDKDGLEYKCLWKINLDSKNYFLGSDYIGFSKQWITEDISDKELVRGLSKTSCIAGRMLWCKGFTKGWYESHNGFKFTESFRCDFITVNQAKGGGRGFFIMFTNSWTQNPENKINYTHE